VTIPAILSTAREAAVVVSEPERHVVRVRGPDAKSWLNGVITCDVRAVTPSRGTHGLLLSKQGKIQAELDVIESADGLLLGVRAREPQIAEWLDRFLIMEDAELSPEPELAWLRLHGAAAVSAASRVRGASGSGAIDWLGVGGAALVVPKSEVTRALQETGAQVIDEGGPEWALLRIAFGFPSFGLDYGADSNPHEVSLERRAVSWDKGCYLGQEVVCMQDMRGKVKRRLVALRVEGGQPLATSLEVKSPAQVEAVGSLATSASEGDVTLAFARLSAPFFEGNQPLSADGRPARIVTPTAFEDGTFSS
jgi:folate-binding protein YgfZ